MADLVLGAALGTAFTVLYDAVLGATLGKSKKNRLLLGALESTLASIQPLVIKQIGVYNVKLELDNDEVKRLESQMRRGEELICKLSKLRWWSRVKSRYIAQLVDLDTSLKGLMQHIVLQQARDIKENLLVAKQTAKQLMEFQELNEKLLQERMSLQEGAKDLQERLVSLMQNNGEQLLHLQQVIDDMMVQQQATDLAEAADLVRLNKMLLKKAEHLLKQNVTFKPVITSIKSTLHSLEPVIALTFNDPDRFLIASVKAQVNSFAARMREGVELLSRCLKVGNWNIYKTFSNSRKLIQWEESLRRERDMMGHHYNTVTKKGLVRSCPPLTRSMMYNVFGRI